MTGPKPSEICFRVEPGDVPAGKAARRLHLTRDRFTEILPRLLARGFPAADPDTGMFDLEEIDRWRKGRHEGEAATPPDPKPDMAERFISAMREKKAARRIRRRSND